MENEILKIGAKQIPYFRTDEFSQLMFEIEKLFVKILNAPMNSKFILLTASGTGAMEAAVMNLFTEKDKVLVINGGTFGKRFAELCRLHGIDFRTIDLKFGERLTEEHLKPHDNKGYTALLVNIHETSTGQLYDKKLLSEFCKKNDMLFVVDAISSFLADEYDIEKYNIDCTILSSQKALALPPGLSFLILSEKSVERIKNRKPKNMYFNLSDYLSNMERGQTPFTPAVGIVYQLYEKLKNINNVGVRPFIEKTKKLAHHFRENIDNLNVVVPDYSLSNALTPILVENAFEVFLKLKKKGIFVTPSGGSLKNRLLRIGHIGNLTTEDNETLIRNLEEIL
ncbi:aspartate aminotransferase [Thermosipho melanesiensis]|uniref:Aminotransferase, class V n=2 Tax=Thermosipho melanesiensis TaxID=46541 RepID=A6LLD0_THEM4|nr:aminotransferase class V-fold PLP-dependent enzyme [Thermosipho melanesiensis]ABR30731.1 aminotransferase, class V [Thermosipho melanesiensis BI429]APT73857.1 aspartate aminotransferase [Thermosipho melanesiensis]OOC35798.1 aspartate aminotransferase [Thermosipho melanesiensis]OOC38300.1 aspartate aminotransferase [Thermosipho melanesiensis]OOC38761.1 aspartate aminotransferase [Thermosipho melanesiensis]